MVRPIIHLATIARRYPDAWRRYDEFRAMRGGALGDWPTWCWCPLHGAAYAIVSGGR